MADSARVTDDVDIAELFRKRDVNRPVYNYQLPSRLAEKLGITQIGLVELTANEVLAATRRSNMDQIAMAFELAREALRYIDQQKILVADGTADEFWARTTPGMSQLRQLAMAAYGQIHSPAKEETLGFLASQSMQIG